MEILKVISTSEVKEDVNTMPYKIVEFESAAQKSIQTPSGVITVKCPTRKSSRAFQGHVYLELKPLAIKLGKTDKDGKPEYAKLTAKEIEGVTPEFGFDLNVGDMVTGSIVKRAVEAYDIVDESTGDVRAVESYSRVILGDTGKFEFQALIVQEFRRQGHELIQVNPDLVLKTASSKEEVEMSV